MRNVPAAGRSSLVVRGPNPRIFLSLRRALLFLVPGACLAALILMTRRVSRALRFSRADRRPASAPQHLAKPSLGWEWLRERLASELLTRNPPGNPSVSRHLLAPSNNGWYAPGKEDSDGGRCAAPETPAVGLGQVADLRRGVRQGRQGGGRDAALAHRLVSAGAHPKPGQRGRSHTAEERPRAQPQGPGEGGAEGRGVTPRGRVQGGVDREHAAQKKSGWA